MRRANQHAKKHAKRPHSAVAAVAASIRMRSGKKQLDLPDSVEMRSHLSDIGAILDLRSKRPSRNIEAIADTPESTAVSAKRTRWWLPSLAVVMIVWAGATTSSSSPSSPMPESLLGEWTTAKDEYADRYLAFTPTEIAIGGGGAGDVARYPIARVHLKESRDSIVVELTYLVKGEPVELQATLFPTAPALLIFSRPSELIWVPVETIAPVAGRN